MPQTMPPQRHVRRVVPGQPQQAQQVQGASQQQQPLASPREELRALNSALLIVSQKLQFIVRNEKILGRNLVVLSKKLNELDSKIDSQAGAKHGGLSDEEMQKIMHEIDVLDRKIAEFQASLTELSENAVMMDKFQEIKYVIDSINPLEFVTINQLDSFVEKKVLEMKQKKKI